nr:hypothetical protein [Fibrobacter sp. NR9]
MGFDALNISAAFVGDFTSMITAGFALVSFPLKIAKSMGRFTCTE